MEQKIYLSLKEAENLVFNKLIVIPKTRLHIERAQKDWSIALFIEKETLIEFEEQLILIAGGVCKYEIPEKEENLFLNHFRVPKGLVVVVNRKYRDIKNEVDEIKFPNEVDYTQEIKFFKIIRRGLLQCYALAINNTISKEFSKEAINGINTLNGLSTFKFNFIKELILNEFYPIKERNDGNFHPEFVKRFNWLGSYIFNEFPQIKELNGNDVNEAKKWLLNLKDKENCKAVQKAIGNVPNIFFEEFEFIMGYYMAASFYEEANIGDDYYNEIINQLKKVELNKNNKILFWAIFFQAIFKHDLDFLYVIRSVQKQQQRIECKIMQLLFRNIELSCKDLDTISFSKKQGVAEYLQLQDGGAITDPIFINENDKKEILENNFSNKGIMNIGLETCTNLSFNYLFPNKCAINKTGFSLNLTSQPSNLTFYVNDDSEVKSWLKALKIKTKPVEKLIDNNKKALVGFLIPESYEHSLFKVYEWILNNADKPKNFKTVIIVLLVNEEIEYIQSPSFQNTKLEMERFCKSKFGSNTSILVKNERVNSDGEIKRNLKHLLEQYSIKDIELINENLDDKIHNWVLSVNNEFVIESEINDYYTFINK